MSGRKKTFTVKIILAGDGAVGKTSLRRRFLGRGFKLQYMQTVGADFAVQTIGIGNYELLLQIWDLSGQPRFKDVREIYYSGSKGALIVFDITRRDSFDHLGNWVEEIWRNNGSGFIPVVILGNKSDLRDQVDCVDNAEALAYAETLSKQITSKAFKLKYLETSAKTGLNVDEAFKLLGSVYIDFIEKRS